MYKADPKKFNFSKEWYISEEELFLGACDIPKLMHNVKIMHDTNRWRICVNFG